MILMKSLGCNNDSLTLSNDLKSYNMTCLESTPAANMRPSGSNEDTGRLLRCITPYNGYNQHSTS